MSRIDTREAAVIFIYQYDFRKEELGKQMELYIDEHPDINEDLEYFKTTVEGVLSSRDSLDKIIESFLKNWTLARIPKLDKAILETAVYEISADNDIPTSVAINEAVKLAKKYGTEDSYSYINGVLSSYEKSL